MKYELLAWDSQFFGLRVARITIEGVPDDQRLSACLQRSDADVVYVFVPSALAEQHRVALEESRGLFCDRKVTYEKVVDGGSMDKDAAIEEATAESEDLLRLAYESGHLSRFYRDPQFRPHFEALYAEWVRKALKSADAKVFALSGAQRIRGMVTTSVANGAGLIGLLAIDETCRGQGLGARLLRRCESFYSSFNAPLCRVVTQEENVAACRLYEKSGYRVADVQDVWHVWRHRS
jgi:dTDP-4-amino-4,6-dideoxy-D-galactose acyltransferase